MCDVSIEPEQFKEVRRQSAEPVVHVSAEGEVSIGEMPVGGRGTGPRHSSVPSLDTAGRVEATHYR